ncbi:MAG: hypothetical protein R3B45_13440 [Bdellovibrionota bacterium]
MPVLIPMMLLLLALTPMVHFWIRQMGNTTIGATANSNEYVSSVLTDSSGNIVISGYTHSSLVEANSGFGDGFVAKFNSNGTYLWARQLGSTTIGVAAAGHENLIGMGLRYIR